MLDKKEVAEVALQGDSVRGILKRALPLGVAGTAGDRFQTRVPEFGDPDLLPALSAAGVKVSVLEPEVRKAARRASSAYMETI